MSFYVYRFLREMLPLGLVVLILLSLMAYSALR